MWRPLTDIRDAWWLAEKVDLFAGRFITKCGGEWCVFNEELHELVASGETPQLAICLAVLDVAGVEHVFNC